MKKTILSAAVLKEIEAAADEGDMYRVLSIIQEYVDNGMNNKEFTMADVCHDLELALWVAYADNNIDDYDHYVHGEQWLKRVEDLATGCGVWYYRYAVCLLYLGRLQEALAYAEQGVLEEPDYPWGWLVLAALLSHFGDPAGALAAVEKGLALEPGDYEFLTRQREIKEGKTLAEMMNHFISPEEDAKLMEAAPDDPLLLEKQQAVAGILGDREKLKQIKEALEAKSWRMEGAYCYCSLPYNGEMLDCSFEMNENAVSKYDIAWMRQLKATLPQLDSQAAGLILRTVEPKIPAASLLLKAMVFLPNQSLVLSYAQTGKRGSIAVLFDNEFQIREQLFYDTEHSHAFYAYSAAELATVEQHIQRYFGPYGHVFHELESTDIHVDICVIEPTAERNYYTLVTCGMGAWSMKLPEELAEQLPSRAELLLCLPPDWRLASEEDCWAWPMRALKVLSRLPARENNWLGWGHTIAKGSSFAENTALSGVILMNVQEIAEEGHLCRLPNGEDVVFYQVIPLYEEEMAFKLEYGMEALVEKMEDVSHVIDVRRPNVCRGFVAPEEKTYFLAGTEMKLLLPDWQGPEGCIATDRIMVDGAKVGYLYREEPNGESFPDSGWRFTAGDETNTYMDDMGHTGVYTLNTVCNYDPDIIPLLDAPYGTAYYRDENGLFRQETIGKALS